MLTGIFDLIGNLFGYIQNAFNALVHDLSRIGQLVSALVDIPNKVINSVLWWMPLPFVIVVTLCFGVAIFYKVVGRE